MFLAPWKPEPLKKKNTMSRSRKNIKRLTSPQLKKVNVAPGVSDEGRPPHDALRLPVDLHRQLWEVLQYLNKHPSAFTKLC